MAFFRPPLLACLLAAGLSPVAFADEGEVNAPAPDAEEAAAEAEGAPTEADAPPAQAGEEAADADVFKPVGFGGLPALNYNSDEGFGYGVIGRVFWYDQDKMDVQPYSKRLTLRIFLTTKWIQSHMVELDALDFMGLPLRLRVRGTYYTTVVENFCGPAQQADCDFVGAQTAAVDYFDDVATVEDLSPYLDPEDPTRLTSDTSGFSAEEQEVYDYLRLYYKQRYREPYLWIDTRTKVKELPNKVEVMASWRGSYYQQGTRKEPTDYPGSLLTDYPAYQSAGLASVLQAGIMLDNRDFEASPTRGYWIEASGRVSHRYIGSNWDYVGANLTLRGYQGLLPEGRLVLAEQATLDGAWGDLPANEMARVGGSQIITGWGGQYFGRGIRSNRYLGRAKAASQTELRLNLGRLDAGTQRFDFGVLGFADLGVVAVDWSDLKGTSSGLIPGVGGGFRFAWNRNFIVRLDVGFSPVEEWGPRVYINLDHIF